MNATRLLTRACTRRNFLQVCGVAAIGTMFPWLAYATEADDLEAEAEALEEEAEAAQAEADELSAKLDALEEQYNEALDRYNAAVEAHDAAVEAMEEAEVRIEESEELVAELQEQLASRAAAIYREGSPSMLDVIFGSSDFSDFLKNWDAMQRISEQDAELVQQSKDAKAAAEAAREEYAAQEVVAAEELEAAEEAKAELEAAQESLQAEYDAMSDEVAAIEAEMEQVLMDAEEAREKEEAAKKAAEEALAAQTNGTVTTVDGWVNPAPGKTVTSSFGYRPSLGGYHYGVDLSCSYETYSCMADGTVTKTGWYGTGGLAVIVNHGGGLVTWYLHNSELLVSTGDTVVAGQTLAVSGNTGRSTGPHLHFQINVNSTDGITGTAVDPELYFSW